MYEILYEYKQLIIALFLHILYKCLRQNLTREKELLTLKLKNTFESDVDSFGLRMYTANEEYTLDNPTKTTAIVLGFVDNNNKLLDKIGVLSEALEDKMRLLEKQEAGVAELRADLNQALAQNRVVSAEYSSVHSVLLNVQQDKDQLQRQVSQLSGTLVHMAQENKMLKERMKLYQF